MTRLPLLSEDSVEVRTSDWLLCFSDLSALTPIFDSGFLLIRPIIPHVTVGTQLYVMNSQKSHSPVSFQSLEHRGSPAGVTTTLASFFVPQASE